MKSRLDLKDYAPELIEITLSGTGSVELNKQRYIETIGTLETLP